jgi:hypothetical protein
MTDRQKEVESIINGLLADATIAALSSRGYGVYYRPSVIRSLPFCATLNGSSIGNGSTANECWIICEHHMSYNPALKNGEQNALRVTNAKELLSLADYIEKDARDLENNAEKLRDLRPGYSAHSDELQSRAKQLSEVVRFIRRSVENQK